MRGTVLLLLTGLLTLCLCSAIVGEPYPDRRVLTPYQSVATSVELWSLRYNPAALAVDEDWQFYYAHTYSDSEMAGNDLVYTGFDGVAFGVEWLGSGGKPNARHQIIALSKEIKKRIFLGTSYRWVSSDDVRENKAHFWTHSLLVRPNERFSFAVRVDNANHMRYQGSRTDAIYTYSAGLNLGKSKFIIGADYHQLTGQKLSEGSYHLFTSVEPLDGLTIFGDYGDRVEPFYGTPIESNKFGLGIRLDLAEMMVSTFNAFDKDGKFFRGNAAFGSFKRQQRTSVRPRHDLADLLLGGKLTEKEYPAFFFSGDPALNMKYFPSSTK